MYRTRTIRMGRRGLTKRGLTLVELLIAMVVLLVGIYAVAAGFPRLLQTIRGEGDRTAMTRLVEQALSRISDAQYGLPDAITGGGSLDTRSFPQDLTAPHVPGSPDNPITALEDVVEVRGESFRVPAPPVGMGYNGFYVLAQGPCARPANWATDYPYVYMLVPLTERPDLDVAAVTGNWFYVDTQTGDITVPTTVTTFEGSEARPPWTVDNVVVDYAWTTPPGGGDAEPIVHHVHGETPTDVTTGASGLVARVHPARLGGGIRLVPGQTKAWAKVLFGRESFGTSAPSASGRYVLDNRYGLTLKFHPADVGLTLKVDYRLQTDYDLGDIDSSTGTPKSGVLERRKLLMMEDLPIESAKTREENGTGVPYGEVRLAVKSLETEPLFATDMQGTALTPPVSVVAVDLQTGEVHTDDLTSLNPLVLDSRLLTAPLDPALEDGYQNGIVAYRLDVGNYLGHTWRFFYRTLDRHTVQVQKAPRYYVDDETARSYQAGYTASGQDEVSEVDYRTYRLRMEDAPDSNALQLGVLEFGQWLPSGGGWASAESSGGETVAVSYAYVRATRERQYVWGELHTVPLGGRTITLNHATLAGQPIEVLAVNGVSARAKAWWLNRTGRQQTLDVETLFLANPLGDVPRVM